jgi:RHS repeat-associated protein
LNRTDSTKLSGTTYITYTYDAGGMLLRKKAYNSGTLTQTDYIGGFVYTGNGTTQTLAYAPMPEGRLIGATLTQEYVITDPQGNARVAFQNVSGVAKVTQENSYYGYGLLMPGSLVGWSAPPNKNLYNGGSEWQNDTKGVNAGVPNYYQTFYRNYDPALARWVAVDPMAEGAESMGVYHYSGDNPVMGNDPGGDLANVKTNQSSFQGGFSDPALDNPSDGFMNQLLGGGGTDDDSLPGGSSTSDVDANNEQTNVASSYNADSSTLSGDQAITAITTLFKYSDGSELEVADGSNAVFQVLADGSLQLWGFQQQPGADGTPGDGTNVIDYSTLQNFNNGNYKGVKGILLTAVNVHDSNAVDPTTVGVNYLGLVYLGSNDPMTYGGQYDYTTPPANLSDRGAMGHDKGYDSKHAVGLPGLLFNTDVIAVDYTLVGQTLSVWGDPFNGASLDDRVEGLTTGIVIGILATPKTVVYGLGQALLFFSYMNVLGE